MNEGGRGRVLAPVDYGRMPGRSTYEGRALALVGSHPLAAVHANAADGQLSSYRRPYPERGTATNPTRRFSMTNLVLSEMRSLSDAEVDAVAGGSPAAFLAGFALGAAAVTGAAVGALGAAAGIAIADAVSEDDEEVATAPGTDENGDFIEEGE